MRHATILATLLGCSALGASAQSEGRVSLFHPAAALIGVVEDQPGLDGSEQTVSLFGDADTQHMTFGTMVAPNFMGQVDVSLFGQYTYFLVDDLEVGVEAALWGFFQDNNTVGVSSSLVIRYHFYQAERWSAFAEAGMGLMVAGDDVPDDGTSVNLMPRFGAGVTWQISEESPTRLITGLRWHHISNARTISETDNPARDAPGLYVGMIYEF